MKKEILEMELKRIEDMAKIEEQLNKHSRQIQQILDLLKEIIRG
jgi:methyl-accepting chemotaxis protein